jgi:hypothetical protein
MKKQFGIFKINTEARYYKDGLNSVEFLSERYLHDTEEDAIRFFPSEDGYYVIMPVYVTTEQKEFNDYQDYKIKCAEQLLDAFKRRSL